MGLSPDTRLQRTPAPEDTIRVTSITFILLTILIATGCRNSSPAAGRRTEHERDSILGQTALPGARGVAGALKVSDSARARRATLDSTAAAP
jgi:hypothetical protein